MDQHYFLCFQTCLYNCTFSKLLKDKLLETKMSPLAFVFMVCCFLIMSTASAESTEVKEALIRFMAQLSSGNSATLRGWNSSSDPCVDTWTGVVCDSRGTSVMKIVLDRLNLSGTVDAESLCVADSLTVFSLSNNNVVGKLPEEISKCTKLSHLYLRGNYFSGALPPSLSKFHSLRRLDVSDNTFSGELPDMSEAYSLVSFLAQQNLFVGNIPDFNFANLEEFNVSNNHLTGPIPVGGVFFGASSFSGNPGLCGPPLSNSCSASAPAPAPAPAPVPSSYM